jgi:hypothetical protein
MQLTAQDKKAAREGFAYVVIRGGKRVCYASTLGEAKRECGKTGRVVSISGMRYTAQNPLRGSLNVRNPSLNVRNPSAAAADEIGARELVLYIENDYHLFERRMPEFAKALATKMKRGSYDADKAVKLLEYLTKEAAIKYGKEFGGTFSPATRRLAAQELLPSVIERAQYEHGTRNPSLNVRNPKAKGWRVTPRANTAGTHMLAGDYNNLDEAGDAWEICYAIFPPARQNRDMRYKGYGPEWIFTAPNGQVFTVYDRSDVPRIGGVQGQYTFKDLLAWLKTQKKRNPSLNVRNPSLNVRNPSAAEVGHSVGKYGKYAARGAGRAAKSAWHGTKSFLGSAYSSFKKHNPSLNVR